MEYAHKPDDLKANLVVTEPHSHVTCDLDNDIHPLWSRESFRIGSAEDQSAILEDHDVVCVHEEGEHCHHAEELEYWDMDTEMLSEKEYERMMPGLRLATLLFSHSGPLFSQILHGQLRLVEGWIPHRYPLGRLVQLVRTKQIAALSPRPTGKEIDAQLSSFANEVAGTSLTYFAKRSSNDYRIWGKVLVSFSEQCRYAIGLGSGLADYFLDDLNWHSSSPQLRLYLNFQLAITLVHELAHIAWRHRRWPQLLQSHDRVVEGEEPVLEGYAEVGAELGHSWEKWFFAGEISPIERFGPERPSKWLGFGISPYTNDRRDRGLRPDCRRGGHAIPASSINQFFHKAQWLSAAHPDHPAHQCDCKSPVSFPIDLTPLTSISGGVFPIGEPSGSTTLPVPKETKDITADAIDEAFAQRLVYHHNPDLFR